jgi:NhaP-type Na+/H+ or K+/H+ antiporter
VLLILDKSEIIHREALLSITIITVALSALLHGVSAAPLAKRYGRMASRMGECEENRPVAEMPLREGRTVINND